MRTSGEVAGAVYRVWVVAYENWSPASWHDVPPRMVAVEPAEAGCLSAAGAAVFVAAYNQAMLARPAGRWAVSVPVELRYAGDLERGETLTAQRVERFPPEWGDAA